MYHPCFDNTVQLECIKHPSFDALLGKKNLRGSTKELRSFESPLELNLWYTGLLCGGAKAKARRDSIRKSREREGEGWKGKEERKIYEVFFLLV